MTIYELFKEADKEKLAAMLTTFAICTLNNPQEIECLQARVREFLDTDVNEATISTTP